MDFKQFFDDMKDYKIKATFYEGTRYFDIEQLYQAFKDRFISEENTQAEDSAACDGCFYGIRHASWKYCPDCGKKFNR